MCLPMYPYNPEPSKEHDSIPSYQFVQIEDVNRMIEAAVKPLIIKILQLEAGLSEWVRNKEAMQITGIQSSDTLKKYREQKGSLIVHEMHGKIPYYRRSSLIEFRHNRDMRGFGVGFNQVAYRLLTPLGYPVKNPESPAPPPVAPQKKLRRAYRN